MAKQHYGGVVLGDGLRRQTTNKYKNFATLRKYRTFWVT